MKKNKTIIGLLSLGLISSTSLTGCDTSSMLKNAGDWVKEKTDFLPWKDEENKTSVDEKDTTDQNAADGVMALINALTNSSSESDVVAARTAYNALTAAQKSLVTNVVKLEAQEKRIADDKLVKEVVDMIAALTNESTEIQVNAAYTKYSNLEDSLKQKVTNLALLLAQKARIDAKVIVDPVIAMINALNDQSSKEEVKAAETAYLALSDDDKQYIGASVIAKLNAQLQRVLEADITAAQDFINEIIIENLISDASVIDVLVKMSELDLSEAIVDGFTQAQKEKLALLKKTTDSYMYAGTHQAKSWREADWEHDSYGLLSFGAVTLNTELNAEVRPFEVTYYDDGENVHQEFGITLVGDSTLKDSKKQAVFHLYNPDIDTNLRIDFAKGADETFCDGGTIALKHGWNRIEVSLADVSDKNVVNLMVGVLNNEGGVTETSGWMISSFVKYDDSVSGAIRTEYYRVAKIMNAYLDKQEATERNEYAAICEEYAKLTAAEKAMLPEGVATKIAADETAFKVADAEALNELLGQIPAITDQTDLVKYAGDYLVKLSEYKLQYDAFDADQKLLVTNANILQGLDSLSSFGVLSFGDKQITGWSDYGTFPNSVTDTEAGYGTVQKVTTTTADEVAMLFPQVDYSEYDVVYIDVNCPSGSMNVVASSPYWPYNYGTLEIGWNTICIPTEVFAAEYPANSIGLMLHGEGEWKFGKAVGFVNAKGAEELVTTINGLSYTGEASEETAIAEARAAYNVLGMVSKELVTNISKLEQLEVAVDQHYADAVISEIEALEFDAQGETQEAQKAAIEAARSSYESLSDARKALVTNVAKLEQMEATVAQYYKDELVNALKADIEGLVEITSATSFDVALANYVKTGSIKANQYYETEIDQTGKGKVEATITAFESIYTKISDNLDGPAGSPTITKKTDSVYGEVLSVTGTDNDVQLTYKPSDNGTVANYDYIYVLMRTEIDGGFNLWGGTWNSSNDVQTIGGLAGETWNIVKINTSCFNTADVKSEKFNQLDFCLGDLTNNHQVLMTAAYGFVDTAAAAAVTEQIAGLTFTEHSEGEENAIVAARSAYNALGKAGKTLVTNYATLTAMESSVESYYVGTVVDAIAALEFDPAGSTQEAQKTAIDAARALYNALSDARKALVTNLSKLEEMEVAVAAYYKTERLTALEGEISALPEEITTATEVIDVMKIKVALAKYEAHDLYAELQQTSKDKIAALKEDIADIYTTLLDGNSAFVGWDYGSVGDTTTGTDDEFGTVQKITFEDDAQHSLRLPTSEEYEKYDEIYISVYCPSGSLTLVNGDNYWPYNYGSVSEGWNVIKVPGAVFEGTYPDNSLGLLFNGAGEWKFGMVVGCAAEPVPEPITEVIYNGNAINSDKTNWAAFTETGVDATYGNYKVMDLSAYSGTIQVIVNGATAISPSKYTTVTFAIYNPCEENATLENIIAMKSDWGQLATACGGTTLLPGWNEITFNSSLVANPLLNMINIKIALGDSTQDGWKISEFVATKAKLTATSYHFGQVTDTGEDDPIYGNIYNLIQDQWFIDNPDAATMAAFAPGTLSALLADGQTELVFKIYNPNAEAVNLHIAGGNPWADAPSTISLAPQAWTEVVISAADIAVTDVAGANFYFYIGSSNTTGWKVTDIFAK